MKYRFTRDDGAVLDVQSGLWESILEIAYENGWIPAGTEEPRTQAWRRSYLGRSDAGHILGPRPWPKSDYFSSSSQYVRATDASAMAAAVLRALPGQRNGGAGGKAEARDCPEHGVAMFARGGGFVIGRKPEPA